MLSRMIQTVTGPWTRANGISWLKLIVFILFLRWAFLELYSIPSSSMEPTLHGDARYFRGDRVAVNKAVFGPRIPFTSIRIFPLADPKRWDIVVFNAVDPNAEHPILIKRVVGLPGERVHIRNGRVYANGEPLDPPEHLKDILYYTTTVGPQREWIEERLLEWASVYASGERMNADLHGIKTLREDLERLSEGLGGAAPAALAPERRAALLAQVRPVTFQIAGEFYGKQMGLMSSFRYAIEPSDEFSLIPEDHYLLLGDNSINSGDGRQFGWVPHENLYGRAFAVVLPWAHRKDLTGFTKTWWGKVLLFGLPGLLIVYEVMRAYVGLSWKVRRENEALGLSEGDHVWLNRLALGLRIPFSRKYFWRRPPQHGDALAFLVKEADSGHTNLHFGRLVRAKGERLTIDTGDAKRETETSELLGRVESVWWPLNRRRRLASTGESASS